MNLYFLFISEMISFFFRYALIAINSPTENVNRHTAEPNIIFMRVSNARSMLSEKFVNIAV